ncbi:MAG: hypothetical protein KF752_17455 [Pirellulaceae bacterium]|nr:hypothetical protein [Pirellulaceae bacterium]
MQLVYTHIYLGCNRWSKRPVLEAIVQFDERQDRTAAELSSLIHCLHTQSGVDARCFEPQNNSVDGQYLLAFEYEEAALLIECIETAIRLCIETPRDQAIDSSPQWRRLVDMADDVRLGPSSQAILQAASERDIPYFRMNQGSLVQFGEGVLQRRTWTAETDATSAIAESIASDKQLTRSILAAVGVNVPQGRMVVSREDAWQAATEFGLPVAVKPRNANHAVGVTLDLTDQTAVMAAYDWACQAGHTTEVLVEQFIQGDHHRLLVIGGKMIAAARGQREYVYGDGIQTVRQLVQQLNSDPRRGENYTDQLQVVKLDDAAAIVLQTQGLDFDSVPEKDRRVLIFHVGDLIEDCTDKVHPTTRDMAVLAAQAVGLDIAGMDVVARDISRCLAEQRGGIVEVNAGPSLTPHVKPLIGSPRPVGQAVMELLYPQNRPSRIAHVLCVAEQDSTWGTELSQELQRLGYNTGIAWQRGKSDKVWPLTRPLEQYHSLLMHPQVNAVVIQSSVGSIAGSGLSCAHVELAIVPQSLCSRDRASADALATLRNLLNHQGLLVVVPDTSNCSDNGWGLPADRVVVCEDFPWIASQLDKLLTRAQAKATAGVALQDATHTTR